MIVIVWGLFTANNGSLVVGESIAQSAEMPAIDWYQPLRKVNLSETYPKSGDAFDVAGGQYSVSSTYHEIILGNWPNLGAGYANYTILVEDLTDVIAGSITISWRSLWGKGLHSIYKDRQGHVELNGHRWDLNCTNRNGPNNDYYYNSAFVYSLALSIPSAELIKINNSLHLAVDEATFWDVQTITLTIIREFTPPEPINDHLVTLSKNGTDFEGVAGEYLTATHQPPAGAFQSLLLPGEIILGAYFDNNSTWTGASIHYSFDTADFKDETRMAVLNISWLENENIGIRSSQFWDAGAAGEVRIAAGTPETVSHILKCEEKVDDDYYLLLNAQKRFVLIPIPASAISATTEIFLTTANYTMVQIQKVDLSLYSGSGLSIVDGKIYDNKQPWLVKGIAYTPWIKETGPDPYTSQPLPAEYADVTELVRNEEGELVIPDLNRNGQIETFEVIEYDLVCIRELKVNTIRTYAAGTWHDKNLNGVFEPSSIPEEDEFVQGDLPDWLVDRMLAFCLQEGMKVILGYWVQEEDFADENPSQAGYQLECNEEDLKVANDTLKRVIDRYCEHPSVLGWGIGNEVHGSWNHKWFDWGMDINTYLNQLFDGARKADRLYHPILYAKYNGESADFTTLTVDIIAPNCYVYSISKVISLGSFDPPASYGQAYLLGEYGHELDQAKDQ